MGSATRLASPFRTGNGRFEAGSGEPALEPLGDLCFGQRSRSQG